MRDFPIFTTDYGVSSLILKEIPYKSHAYIRILDVQEAYFEEHLSECISFCRMCGAEQIFAEGNEKLERFPLYTAVNRMQGTACADPEKVASLFPVTEETVGQWRRLYNESMRGVDNAGTLETRDEKEIMGSGGAYFVHDCGDLLGIFWLQDMKLLAIAATRRGSGERIMHTMMSLVDGEQISLDVASTNEKAIRLYEKMGFVATAQLKRWYRVL
jgi:RimJ/RimL family protein N-acetyltransferase